VELRHTRDSEDFGRGSRGRDNLPTGSFPSKSEEEFVITEFEPDTRLAIRGTLGPLEGTLIYILEPIADGTHLTNEADLEGQGLMKFAAPIAGGRVRGAVAANLSELKALLESSSS
jgi:hypothetical protein